MIDTCPLTPEREEFLERVHDRLVGRGEESLRVYSFEQVVKNLRRLYQVNTIEMVKNSDGKYEREKYLRGEI